LADQCAKFELASLGRLRMAGWQSWRNRWFPTASPILLSGESVRCVQKRRSDRCKYIQTNSFTCPRFSRIDLNENGYRKYLRGDASELV